MRESLDKNADIQYRLSVNIWLSNGANIQRRNFTFYFKMNFTCNMQFSPRLVEYREFAKYGIGFKHLRKIVSP